MKIGDKKACNMLDDHIDQWTGCEGQSILHMLPDLCHEKDQQVLHEQGCFNCFVDHPGELPLDLRLSLWHHGCCWYQYRDIREAGGDNTQVSSCSKMNFMPE